MKRTLGLMAANWLKKPENQEKVKRTARDLWSRLQQNRSTSDTGSAHTEEPAERSTDSAEQAVDRDRGR